MKKKMNPRIKEPKSLKKNVGSLRLMVGVDLAMNAIISTQQRIVNGSRRLENVLLRLARIFTMAQIEIVHSGAEDSARMRDVG